MFGTGQKQDYGKQSLHRKKITTQQKKKCKDNIFKSSLSLTEYNNQNRILVKCAENNTCAR